MPPNPTTWLNAALARLSDALIPPVCLSCQKRLHDHDTLCAVCWRDVHFIGPPLCDALGLPMPYDTGGKVLSARAIAHPPAYQRARAVARYDGPLRTMVHRFKYADRHDARVLFGRWLVQAGGELLRDADVVVPVPLAGMRLWVRRYNQAAVLAHEVGRLTGVPVAPLALRRMRRTRPQVGLTAAQRRQNVAGAFKVMERAASRVRGRRVVLVDDVITTGATVEACAQALLRAGAAQVDVLALGLVTGDTGPTA
ncbi:MAG: ComF family protein [Pseudomonadota bacterium]